MKKRAGRPRKARSTKPAPPQNRRKLGAAATLLPLAVSMIPGALTLRQPAATTETTAVVQPAPQAARKAGTGKHFMIPVNDLRTWASSVLVTINDVTVEGNSKVHQQDNDCEIHFGAHAPSFKGNPDGIVLEPMNACSAPFPGKPEQKNSDWIDFANKIRDTTVSVTGVPRIWPEHLTGSHDESNPNHALELHPLTSVVSNNQTLDFAANVFAGEYRGGVGLPTAQNIVKKVFVTVTRNGNNADIAFFGGQIGNFTVLEINVDRASIAPDPAGSFRMNGEVVLEDGSTVPVRMVTIKDSPYNNTIGEIRSNGSGDIVALGEVLVLFSLSPEFLLSAATQSNGQPVMIEHPIQLILFGPPDV